MRRKTKIIATLGPAVSSPEDIRGLMDHGMNVARLNFSHGTHEQHERWFRWVRQVSEEADKPVAVMQDIQGPKLRVGTFPGGSVTLLADAEVMLEPGEGEGDTTRICVAYLGDVELEPGSSVLLADGLIALEVLSVKPGRVAARIVTGGVLRDHKGAAFPGAAMRIPAITPKDEVDLAFGMELGFDLIAASFVGRSDDLRQIRRHVGDVPIIAKIESAVGYANLDEILTEADGAMVARGDLGVEVSLERVPRMQTEILARTNASGKISITATEMLESMTLAPRPTRAEVTDVYRSVLEGTDAVMLSAETAIGEYPVRAVRAMDIICREAEASPEYMRAPEVSMLADRSRFGSATAQASVDTADRLGLDTIVAFTESGTTARLLGKYRPRADVYAFTPNESTYRQMAVYGGVTPLRFERVSSTDKMINYAERHLLAGGIVEIGDGLVMVAGIPPNQRASTNLMKLHEVGSSTLGVPS
jgi:pyruvate kinase